MDKNKFMKEALKEAKKAYLKEEIPVGVVIVKNGKIITRAHNLKETKNSSIAHAEILAIEKASKKLQNWRLIDCEMYVTLEPCIMCMGAIMSSRINKLYFGAKDDSVGASNFAQGIDIEGGILKEECEYILRDFFKMIRKKTGGKNDKG